MADRVLKVVIVGDAGGATRALKDTEIAAGDLETKTGGLSSALSTLAPVFLGIGAATAGIFGVAISQAADFEQSMTVVGAVSGATGQAFADLKQLALDMGAQTAFSAKEAADAMGELAKGGVSTADIMGGALQAALNLAAAGGLSLADAASITANALAIFGLDGTQAAQVADTFAAAANASTISVEDLQQSMIYVGPVAAALGISIQETAAAIAELGANGIAGSQAGTALRTMLVSLSAPSTEAKNLMQELGIAAFDAQGNFVGMAALAGQLQTALGGMADAQKIATLETLFGKEGMSAALAVMNGGQAGMQDWIDKVSQQGAAQDQANKMLDNTKGALDQLKGSLETISIVLGSIFLPYLRQAIDSLTGLANQFLALDPTMQTTIAAVALIAGAFVGLVGVAVTVGPTLLAVGGALGVLAGPLAIVAAAVALLGVAWTQNWGDIQGKAQQALAVVMPLLDQILAWFQGPALQLPGQFGAALMQLWDYVRPGFEQFRDLLMGGIGGALQVIQPLAQQLAQVFAQQWPAIVALWDQLSAAVEPLKPLVEALAAVFGGLIAVQIGLAMGVIGGLIGLLTGALPGAIQFVSGAIEIMGGVLQTFQALITGVVTVVDALIRGDWSRAWDAAQEAVRGMRDGILSIVSGLGTALEGLFNLLIGGVVGLVEGFVGTIVGFFQGLYDALVGHSIIPDLVNGIIAWFGQLPGAIRTFLENIGDMFGGFGQYLLDRLGDLGGALAAPFRAAGAALEGFFRAPLEAIGDMFGGFGAYLLGRLGDLGGVLAGVLQPFIDSVNGLIDAYNAIPFLPDFPHLGLPGTQPAPAPGGGGGGGAGGGLDPGTWTASTVPMPGASGGGLMINVYLYGITIPEVAHQLFTEIMPYLESGNFGGGTGTPSGPIVPGNL